METSTLVNSKPTDVVHDVFGALLLWSQAWLRVVGAIKVVGVAWAEIKSARSEDPPPDSATTNIATPEQLAAVVADVTYAPEPPGSAPGEVTEQVHNADPA